MSSEVRHDIATAAPSATLRLMRNEHTHGLESFEKAVKPLNGTYEVNLCDGRGGWRTLSDFILDVRENGIVGELDKSLGCCGVIIGAARKQPLESWEAYDSTLSDEADGIRSMYTKAWKLTWASQDHNDFTIKRERVL